jgi:cytidylate kinase
MSLITLSEYWGCGGKEIAEKVAANLKMDLFDDARLQAEALEMGVRAEELKGLEMKLPGLFDRLFGKDPDMYLDTMQSVVYNIARRGEGVIVGHGSQILLREFGCAMHIRVHASNDARILRLMANQQISPKAAEKLILKRDQEFNGFFKFAFNLDYDDPSLYDLILNTGKISTETAARQITALAGSDDMKACSLGALETMERLALEKKVNSDLLRQGVSLKMIFIEVPEPGVVRLYGIATDEKTRAGIIGIVEKISGVSKVKSEIIINPQAL